MQLSRRTAIKGLAAVGAPMIVPASVFGANAPSNRVAIGAIGVGRISRGHDIKEVMKHGDAQIVAVCDVDTRRLAAGRDLVDAGYAEKSGKSYSGTRIHADYRELLAAKDIDAVLISTPDHQHAPLAIQAVRAGKDVYLQKPASLTIAEGRAMADAVAATGRKLQIGSQQRGQQPWPQFHRAAELVRNGRIGALKHVEIGLPGDPAGPEAPPMPIPANLDYDAWLGTTPEVYYTEIRVHPQNSLEDRPGWLRCEQFGAGMITGWGSHHVDIAHWGMDMERSGPVEIWGRAEFPKSGLWDVHGPFETHARYANGMTMTISGALPNGVKFVGDKGWIFVTRSGSVTASDPGGPQIMPLQASDPKILASVIGPDEVHLLKAPEQHRNWLDAIRTGAPLSAPAEIGHRACSTCLLHHIAMKTRRRLRWDPLAERFLGDDAANALLSRPQRARYAL
ncbi:Gfo/Idh/MocA family protein [Sphingosinicella sp. BN140058]|uniref:Gfo/Idh/MocA family protein n=1 Tax=Sphingosinicella sp. BN140058 TaxID=1892855 RepID=UPI001013BFC5|nr:Gfo/Idh/MocA family oxidoreductase [Sphingosinicella sp. BN140058]QAY75425.1 Gfo/Idh/MocA family oxidoreductase [Sphingosinicella sp. BN140058]